MYAPLKMFLPTRRRRVCARSRTNTELLDDKEEEKTPTSPAPVRVNVAVVNGSGGLLLSSV